MTTITKPTRDDHKPGPADKIRMTAAMREGLDSLQREYTAFVESSHKALALINGQRVRRRR
jgi:predicted secreted protein